MLCRHKLLILVLLSKGQWDENLLVRVCPLRRGHQLHCQFWNVLKVAGRIIKVEIG